MPYTTKKTKIYFITECPYVGVFQTLLMFAKDLKSMGFELFFILPSVSRDRYGETQIEHERLLSDYGTILYTPLRRKSRFLLFDILALRSLVRDIKPDILISVTEYAGKVCRILYRNKNIKTYYHAPQCIDVTRKKSNLLKVREYIFEKILANRADYYIACGPSECFLLNQVYGVKQEKIVFVPNHKLVTSSPQNIKKYSYIYLGRIVKNKGIFTILETLSLFNATDQILVVGDGDCLNELKAKYAKTTFVGRVPYQDIFDYFSQARFYVSDSKIEGMSFASIESMALGVVPLLSDVPGHKDIVIDGYNGFLFKNKFELINLMFKVNLLSDEHYFQLSNNAIKTSNNLFKCGINNLIEHFKMYS